MDYLTIESSGIALISIGIMLCIIAALRVIAQKQAQNRIFFSARSETAVRNQEQVFVQWLKQSESALGAIADAIGRERMSLERLLEKKERREKRAPEHEKAVKQFRGQPGRHKAPSARGRYGEIKRLGALGLDAGEIAKKMKIGKAEVDLTLKISRLTSPNRELTSKEAIGKRGDVEARIAQQKSCQ